MWRTYHKEYKHHQQKVVNYNPRLLGSHLVGTLFQSWSLVFKYKIINFKWNLCIRLGKGTPGGGIKFYEYGVGDVLELWSGQD